MNFYAALHFITLSFPDPTKPGQGGAHGRKQETWRMHAVSMLHLFQGTTHLRHSPPSPSQPVLGDGRAAEGQPGTVQLQCH